MSWSMNIFLGPSVPLGEIGTELKSMLGMELTRMFENGEETYKLAAPSYILILGRHDLIDNKGIPFEECPLQIALWATNVPDWETSSKECLRTASSIFEALKTRRRYRLLLVRNVQELLLDYSPSGASC
jgi:hypothetical protein